MMSASRYGQDLTCDVWAGKMAANSMFSEFANAALQADTQCVTSAVQSERSKIPAGSGQQAEKLLPSVTATLRGEPQ